jgi:hypothetical protein
MANMEIILFPFFCFCGIQNFAIHISVVMYFHAIFFHVRIMSSMGTKKLRNQTHFFPQSFQINGGISLGNLHISLD